MKIADLYIRVSTDEQADKGYSQRDQEERLKKYCEINSIQVRKVIFEDHSAKTFNRPEWVKLLIDVKKYKGKSDLILAVIFGLLFEILSIPAKYLFPNLKKMIVV